jgi:hypothetical protein
MTSPIKQLTVDAEGYIVVLDATGAIWRQAGVQGIDTHKTAWVTCLTMSRATYLREKADLCRRVARIPTLGGHRAYRALLALAGKFDREVVALTAGEAEEGHADRFGWYTRGDAKG